MVILIAAVAGLAFVQWRSNRFAVPKSLAPAQSSSGGAPAGQAENRLLSTSRDSKPQESKNGISADSPTSTNAGHPADSETKEAENKVDTPKSKADTPVVDAPAKEPAHEDVDSIRANKLAKKDQPTKNDEPKERPQEEPKRPSMALVKAQQYLQGRGVRQNCSQGLMYLKTAAGQNDPQAAVQMAALYASGHCVHQDLVQAYRWFTSASELQPSNRLIDKNLNWLWAEMTPAQRSQIGK